MISKNKTSALRQSAVPSAPEFVAARGPAEEVKTPEPAGPRKLVRPVLPAGLVPRRDSNGKGGSANHSPAHHFHPPAQDAAHAETFYLQKQIQAQTPVAVVLEDGEELQGVIEWYDLHSIKLWLANRQRVLVYKAAIKYIFKLGENQRPGSY